MSNSALSGCLVFLWPVWLQGLYPQPDGIWNYANRSTQSFRIYDKNIFWYTNPVGWGDLFAIGRPEPSEDVLGFEIATFFASFEIAQSTARPNVWNIVWKQWKYCLIVVFKMCMLFFNYFVGSVWRPGCSLLGFPSTLSPCNIPCTNYERPTNRLCVQPIQQHVRWRNNCVLYKRTPSVLKLKPKFNELSFFKHSVYLHWTVSSKSMNGGTWNQREAF